MFIFKMCTNQLRKLKKPIGTKWGPKKWTNGFKKEIQMIFKHIKDCRPDLELKNKQTN